MTDQQKTDLDHAERDLRHCIAVAAQSQADWRPVWEEGLSALLSDNAALRADLKAADATATKWMRAAGRITTTSEEWKARAIDAERKLSEAEDANARWALRYADIREAAGIGHKPMLSELPDAIRALRAERDEAAQLVENSIDLMTDEYSDTEAHQKAARAFLQSIARETGK